MRSGVRYPVVPRKNNGDVREWLKRSVCKTVGLRTHAGSNPAVASIRVTGTASSTGRAPLLQSGGQRFDPFAVHMKKCSVCTISKPLTDFHKSSSTKTGVQSRCKACNRESRLEYYYANHTVERTRMNKRSRKVYKENRDRTIAYLECHPCVDCGESDSVVLEFDHVRGVKLAPVTSLLSSGSWNKVQEEIDKCDVRCCNCHRRRHHKSLSSSG